MFAIYDSGYSYSSSHDREEIRFDELKAIEIKDSLKIRNQTTIPNCKPKKTGYTFINFLDDKFVLKKDFLVYLIDKYGLIQGYYVGETHDGDARAKQIEAKILELLAE